MLTSITSGTRNHIVLLGAAMRSQMRYRANIVMGMIGGICFQATQIIALIVTLHAFGQLGQWTPDHIAFLASMRLCSHALYVIPFGGIIRTSQLVMDGTFDRLLLRPVNLFTQIVARHFNVLSLGDGILAGALMAVFLPRALPNASGGNYAFLVVAILGGALVELSIHTAIASAAFRWKNAFSLHVLADSTISSLGMYPTSIFTVPVVSALTFAFPLSFIAFLPACALLDHDAGADLPSWLPWASPAWGPILVVLALLLFHRSIRHYTSPQI